MHRAPQKIDPAPPAEYLHPEDRGGVGRGVSPCRALAHERRKHLPSKPLLPPRRVYMLI